MTEHGKESPKGAWKDKSTIYLLLESSPKDYKEWEESCTVRHP